VRRARRGSEPAGSGRLASLGSARTCPARRRRSSLRRRRTARTSGCAAPSMRARAARARANRESSPRAGARRSPSSHRAGRRGSRRSTSTRGIWVRARRRRQRVTCSRASNVEQSSAIERPALTVADCRSSSPPRSDAKPSRRYAPVQALPCWPLLARHVTRLEQPRLHDLRSYDGPRACKKASRLEHAPQSAKITRNRSGRKISIMPQR
jgi:hypothetical protein